MPPAYGQEDDEEDNDAFVNNTTAISKVFQRLE